MPPNKKQKREQIHKCEQILRDPSRFIGSTEKQTDICWVYENEKLLRRWVSYVPGLCSIFDEILIMAATYPTLTTLKVEIDIKESLIIIFSDGYGHPVRKNTNGVYVPEVVYVAHLTNIFSSMFEVETSDGRNKFQQLSYMNFSAVNKVFKNNMRKKSKPKISDITKFCKGEQWTKVTFKPDLARFGMQHLEEDVVALFNKRVLDLAGCGKGKNVLLNGRSLPVRSFLDYVDLHIRSKFSSSSLPRRFTEKINDRWEICVTISQGCFQQVSFVNSISTTKGGTHVDYVTNQISNHVMALVNKKNKQADIKAEDVKNHLWVFVNALIDNPAFDSPTKQSLTTLQSSFGSKCELSQEFLEEVANSEILLEGLDSCAKFMLSKQHITVDSREAEEAGSNTNADKCTLILTNSHEALEMLGHLDPKYYGFILLSGELLNVREASLEQIMEDAKIQHIKKSLGLQHGKVYDNVKSLRYGHLMILTDQVHDGSHIKGILINFIHSFCPLLNIPSFLVEIIIPILKATNKNENILSFYTMSEYKSWKEALKSSTLGDVKDWRLEYFQQGSGTGTSKEAELYFQILEIHKNDFTCVDLGDVGAIDVAFEKTAGERKNWVRELEICDDLEWNEQVNEHNKFVNKHLILFPLADLQRFIPSMVDGLNYVQRKILYCAFKCDLVAEKCVSLFLGYVLRHSPCHLDEESLSRSIIGMAQDFVGANNVNLFNPGGQFGSRRTGGKVHGDVRVMGTNLTPIARFLFPKDDDILYLNEDDDDILYLNEDKEYMEPTWYAPVIPLVLVNGTERIGTGWSTFVPNYDPKELCAYIRCLLDEKPPPETIDPLYKGFKGTIEKTIKDSGESYTVSGKIERPNDITLRILEIPVCKGTILDYKQFLESARAGTGKFKEPFIEKYVWKANDDDLTRYFEILMPKENLRMPPEELMKMFELTTTICTSNMLMFDEKGVIKKYNNPKQIVEDFFQFRYSLYLKRKLRQLKSCRLKYLEIANKVKFIRSVMDSKITIFGKTKEKFSVELAKEGFKKLGGGYNYLLSIQVIHFDEKHIEKLHIEQEKLTSEIDALEKSTPKTLWLKDLTALEQQLDELAIKDANVALYRKNVRARIMSRENNMKKPTNPPVKEAAPVRLVRDPQWR